MRLVPQSLRGRLLVSLLVPLVAIGLIALLNSYREAADIAATVSDRVLAGSALAIAERVVVTDTGGLDVDIPYAALEMLTSAAQDKVFYKVEGPPGAFITGYADLPSLTHDPGFDGDELTFIDADYRGEPVRVAVLRRAGSSGLSAIPFEITVAETTLARGQLSDTIILNAALRLALLIAAAVVIALVSVSLSIRPLYRLSESIARRNPSELSQIDDVVPTEVRGLVDTINLFIIRLGTSLEALRHFTGNASHQLRTPLAIVRTQLTLAQRGGDLQQIHQALRDGDQAVVHAERVLAQLMVLARVDEAASQRAVEGERLNLTALARNITAETIPDASRVEIDLGFEGDDAVYLRADAILIGEMLGNLIDNSLKYAGPGTSVTVQVCQAEQHVYLSIEDTGGGIPEALRGDIKRRFQRGRQDRLGAGLGLSIVDEIAALFAGRVDLKDGTNGKGLLVAITFPRMND